MGVLKRALPAIVAILIGVIVLAAVFNPYPLLELVAAYLIDVAIILAAFALFLGLINVLRVHIRRIRERGPARFFSFVLLAGMLIVLVLGLPSFPNQPSGPAQPAVRWIFEYIQMPIQASFSALLVFFLVTAAYRALRVRNAESTVMCVVALLVLIGQVSVGLVPVLPELKDWILDVPTVAGVRGILLGVALGTVLTGIRLLMGVERPYSD
ncbi:hypothetical protein ACFLYD_07825 [Chloroflexota bacterium]